MGRGYIHKVFRESTGSMELSKRDAGVPSMSLAISLLICSFSRPQTAKISLRFYYSVYLSSVMTWKYDWITRSTVYCEGTRAV